MTTIALPVPASSIWDRLSDFRGGIYHTPLWAECLRMGGWRHAIGESHLAGNVQMDDFKSFPISRTVRIIMMPEENGFILRWGDPDRMEPILGGVFHDHLLREGDQFEVIRSGWLTVLENGCLEI